MMNRKNTVLDNCHHTTTFLQGQNGYRMTGELSGSNELPNGFLERSGSLEPFQEDILQGG
jgi:hypothetical protein